MKRDEQRRMVVDFVRRCVFPVHPQRAYSPSEIRFPVIPLLRLELPKTETAFEFRRFFPIATSFKIVLDLQGAHL